MTAKKSYRVLLADDHTLFLSGLKGLLARQEGIEVVATASNGAECLSLLAKNTCDIVMTDINMPVMNGIDATARIAEEYPDIKVIALSMYGDEEYYFRMVEVGAKGFILKNSHIDEVAASIRTVGDGGNYFSQELLRGLVGNLKARNEQSDKNLSEREKEILLLICKGLSNQEIADKLFISKRTVDKHRANILEKTECKNTANLVVWAIKHSIVEI